VRVIGGRSRGRILAAKVPSGVRPTSDRVRESIFDILGSMGGVGGLSVVDLFCGTGALGLEARSRGAAAVTLVDSSAKAVEATRRNARSVGLDDGITVVRATLPGWLDNPREFDLALCDPPYGFTGWPQLLDSLRTGLVVAESEQEIPVPPGWNVTKTRRYGGTLVTVAQRLSPPPSQDAESNAVPASALGEPRHPEAVGTSPDSDRLGITS
jgi:16S rRNA (guanine966-N2)-methyltransferase